MRMVPSGLRRSWATMPSTSSRACVALLRGAIEPRVFDRRAPPAGRAPPPDGDRPARSARVGDGRAGASRPEACRAPTSGTAMTDSGPRRAKRAQVLLALRAERATISGVTSLASARAAWSRAPTRSGAVARRSSRTRMSASQIQPLAGSRLSDLQPPNLAVLSDDVDTMQRSASSRTASSAMLRQRLLVARASSPAPARPRRGTSARSRFASAP